MATAADIAKFSNRTSESVSLPVPTFVLSELPPKIARLDPAGAKAWHKENNDAINAWIQSQNSVNTDISAAIVKKS
jgi:hypothetical protein